MIVILIVSCCRDASALRRSDALIQSSLHVYYIYIYIYIYIIHRGRGSKILHTGICKSGIELHKSGHMTTGHRLSCKEFLCFDTVPCLHMPLLVHFWVCHAAVMQLLFVAATPSCQPRIASAVDALLRCTLVGLFRCPLFKGPPHYKLTCPYVALFGKMLTQIKLNKDMQAHNEGALTGGP